MTGNPNDPAEPEAPVAAERGYVGDPAYSPMQMRRADVVVPDEFASLAPKNNWSSGQVETETDPVMTDGPEDQGIQNDGIVDGGSEREPGEVPEEPSVAEPADVGDGHGGEGPQQPVTLQPEPEEPFVLRSTALAGLVANPEGGDARTRLQLFRTKHWRQPRPEDQQAQARAQIHAVQALVAEHIAVFETDPQRAPDSTEVAERPARTSSVTAQWERVTQVAEAATFNAEMLESELDSLRGLMRSEALDTAQRAVPATRELLAELRANDQLTVAVLADLSEELDHTVELAVFSYVKQVKAQLRSRPVLVNEAAVRPTVGQGIDPTVVAEASKTLGGLVEDLEAAVRDADDPNLDSSRVSLLEAQLMQVQAMTDSAIAASDHWREQRDGGRDIFVEGARVSDPALAERVRAHRQAKAADELHGKLTGITARLNTMYPFDGGPQFGFGVYGDHVFDKRLSDLVETPPTADLFVPDDFSADPDGAHRVSNAGPVAAGVSVNTIEFRRSIPAGDVEQMDAEPVVVVRRRDLHQGANDSEALRLAQATLRGVRRDYEGQLTLAMGQWPQQHGSERADVVLSGVDGEVLPVHHEVAAFYEHMLAYIDDALERSTDAGSESEQVRLVELLTSAANMRIEAEGFLAGELDGAFDEQRISAIGAFAEGIEPGRSYSQLQVDTELLAPYAQLLAERAAGQLVADELDSQQGSNNRLTVLADINSLRRIHSDARDALGADAPQWLVEQFDAAIDQIDEVRGWLLPSGDGIAPHFTPAEIDAAVPRLRELARESPLTIIRPLEAGVMAAVVVKPAPIPPYLDDGERPTLRVTDRERMELPQPDVALELPAVPPTLELETVTLLAAWQADPLDDDVMHSGGEILAGGSVGGEEGQEDDEEQPGVPLLMQPVAEMLHKQIRLDGDRIQVFGQVDEFLQNLQAAGRYAVEMSGGATDPEDSPEYQAEVNAWGRHIQQRTQQVRETLRHAMAGDDETVTFADAIEETQLLLDANLQLAMHTSAASGVIEQLGATVHHYASLVVDRQDDSGFLNARDHNDATVSAAVAMESLDLAIRSSVEQHRSRNVELLAGMLAGERPDLRAIDREIFLAESREAVNQVVLGVQYAQHSMPWAEVVWEPIMVAAERLHAATDRLGDSWLPLSTKEIAEISSAWGALGDAIHIDRIGHSNIVFDLASTCLAYHGDDPGEQGAQPRGLAPSGAPDALPDDPRQLDDTPSHRMDHGGGLGLQREDGREHPNDDGRDLRRREAAIQRIAGLAPGASKPAAAVVQGNRRARRTSVRPATRDSAHRSPLNRKGGIQ